MAKKEKKEKRHKVEIATLAELKEFIVQVAPKKGSLALRAKLDKDEGVVRLFAKPVDHLEVVLRPDLDTRGNGNVDAVGIELTEAGKSLSTGQLVDAMLGVHEGRCARAHLEEVAAIVQALEAGVEVSAVRTVRLNGLVSFPYYQVTEVYGHGNFETYPPFLIPVTLVKEEEGGFTEEEEEG